MGEVAALAAAGLWAIATLLFAKAGARLPAVSLNLLKTALALVGLGVTAWWIDGQPLPLDLEPGPLGLIAISGFIGLTLGDSLYFLSLSGLGARRALVLWALTPAATTALGAQVLGEPIGPSFLTGLILTTLGVALVLTDRAPAGAAPGLSPVLGILAGLGAVACQAGGSVTAKLGAAGLSGLELSVLRLAFGTAGLIVPGLWALRFGRVSLDRRGFGFIALATVFGTYLGIWLSMFALQNAYAGVVATLGATSPIFVLPIARLLYGEVIGARAAAGAALAVAGVAVLMLAS